MQVAPPPTRLIGDYQLLDVLGRGGMGVVYVAIDVRTGAPAAVKTVHVANESTLSSIRREIQMLRDLQHPGVVQILDTGVAGGVPWYAMELLRGHTLHDYVQAWHPPRLDLYSEGAITVAGPVPSDAAITLPPAIAPVPPALVSAAAAPPPPAWSLPLVLTLFRRLCEPLAYVHGQGVVHRDLTPGNVFLTSGGWPVVVDFGIAAQVHTTSARDVLDVGGFARGTPHYMAPEQARGEIVDARADIYAMGCLLYETITGRPPFVGTSAVVVMMQHLDEPPVPPALRNPEVPPELDELILHMLAKHPRERLGYMVDVAAALERLGAEPPPVAPERRPRSYTYRPSLVGREDWLAGFDPRLDALADGRGAAVVLVGESGVGKTRLATAIATRAVERELRVIVGESDALVAEGDERARRAAPLYPLRPLLRAIAARCRDGGPAVTAAVLAADGDALAPYEPELAEVLSVAAPVDDGASPTTAALAARPRVLAALGDALVALGRATPLVLVLDDLQWLDELTREFLATLSPDRLRDAGVLVIATVRAEELTPALGAVIGQLGATRLDLGRLDRAAVDAMVRDMLALDLAMPALTEFLAATSEGNPFFAAEYLRAAVDEGLVCRDERGRWRLSDVEHPSYDRLPTPNSIHELVRRRLAGLGAPARQVVAAAAILGRESHYDVLAATSGLSTLDVGEGVIELMRRFVVDEAGGGMVRFEHDKLREIAHAELSADERQALHRRAALAIEAEPASPGGERDRHAALAHHWEAAGDVPRAARALELAADHALRQAAFEQAAALLARLCALPIVVDDTVRARWERWWGEAAYALGDLPTCGRHTRAALARLGVAPPTRAIGWAPTIVAGLVRQLVARARGDDAPPRRPRAGDPRPEAALAATRLTSCYFFEDDAVGMIGASLQAVNLAEAVGGDVAVAEAYSHLGYIAGLARASGIAHDYFARAKATAARTEDRRGMVVTLYAQAAYYVGIADWARASATVDDALVRSHALRDPLRLEVGHTIAGHVAFASGDYREAEARAAALLSSARARNNPQHTAWGLYTGGRVALHRGDHARADEHFVAAREILAGISDPASRILCDGMYAWNCAARGELGLARTVADEVTSRIGRRPPTVFTIAEGFIGVVEAYLAIAARDPSPALLAATDVALANLRRFARTFPLAGAAAERLAGARRLVAGDRRGARRLLRTAVTRAIELAIPYDQWAATAALVAATDDPEEVVALGAEAGQLRARLR